MFGRSKWSLTSRWIVPINRSPLPEGVIVVDGERIAAVEPAGFGRADLNLGNAAVLPGFVNAHTHLDLTGLRGLCPPSADFAGWLRCVVAKRRSQTPDQVFAAIEFGLQESIRAGTTLLGDISSDGLSQTILSLAPIRSVVFFEMLGLTHERAEQAWHNAEKWLTTHKSTPMCRLGLSPHAPYSVRASLLARVAALPPEIPVAIHLAETPAELELLNHRDGPFVAFLEEMQVWDPDGLIKDVEHLMEMFRGRPAIFIHGNYLDPQIPSLNGQCIVYCPQTHAAFGHGCHPFLQSHLADTQIAIGTDSLASNPALDVLGEIRFVHENHPQIEPRELLHWATLGGAQALGCDRETGSLTPGKSADLVAVPLEKSDVSDDAFQLVLESSRPVAKTMCRGRWIFDDNDLTVAPM